MAAPRTTRFIALRNLCYSSRQVRLLHTPGPATYVRSTTERSHTLKQIRHFNTTRVFQARYDSSTIDFAYLPDSAAIEGEEGEFFRVPILHSALENPNAVDETETDTVMKPEISTMSADAVFLPMADLSDGHAMNIDFHAMADRVASNLKNLKVPAEEQASMMKQIWNDLVDDMLNVKKSSKQ